MKLLILASLILVACGSKGGGGASGGGGAPSASSDKCFGLAGRYTNGTVTLTIASGPYQYCVITSDYCGETFYATSKLGDGSFQTSGWQGVNAHPECPVAGNSTCRMDIITGEMNMDCGTGNKNYGGKI